MSFTLFRILVLVWNNSPSWLQRLARALGVTRFVHEVWVPYARLPIPPTERPVRRLLERLIQPDWRCADVGANYGMMTEVMAACTRSKGSVVAFEAHPLNVHLLQRRMKLAGFQEQVIIENKAVSDGSVKTLVLYAGRRRSPNEWNVVGHDVGGNPTRPVMEIPAVSLDDYFGEAPLQLVKIDVEGAEVGVIAGMQAILARQRPVCLVEFHSAEAWNSRQAFLRAGYQIYSLDGNPVAPEHPWELHVLLWPPGPPPGKSVFDNSSPR